MVNQSKIAQAVLQAFACSDTSPHRIYITFCLWAYFQFTLIPNRSKLQTFWYNYLLVTYSHYIVAANYRLIHNTREWVWVNPLSEFTVPYFAGLQNKELPSDPTGEGWQRMSEGICLSSPLRKQYRK